MATEIETLSSKHVCLIRQSPRQDVKVEDRLHSSCPES